MKKLLDSTFESAENYVKNSPEIISRLSVHKNKVRIKEAIDACKEYLTDHSCPPILKICAVKFLKDLFDEAIFYVIELIEEEILPIFEQTVLYRQEVKTIRRGSTFLLSQLRDHLKGQDIIEMMSRHAKPSQGYFEIVHECVFYWSKYIEEDKSPFRTVYENVRHCAFPSHYKHFHEKEVKEFRKKYHLEMNAVEYELEDCFKKWEQTKERLQEMEKRDYARENLEEIYGWISAYVTEYTNLLVDLKDSYYYQRKGMKERMLALLVEKKEFLKIYIECVNRNSFNKLFERYGRYEEDVIDEEFGIEKRRKKKKAAQDPEDKRLIDIKKIYLADYPSVLGKLDIVQANLDRNRNFVDYRYAETRAQNNSRVLETQAAEEEKAVISSTPQPSVQLPVQKPEMDKAPPKKLKSSFITSGLAVLGGPEPPAKKTPFLILPSQSETIETPSKKLRNSSQSEVRKDEVVDLRSSLNNVNYRQ